MSHLTLGISAFFHDSAAALVRAGEIVAAAQEERFSRVKHDARFPSKAIDYCLAEAGVGSAEVSTVVYYENPTTKFDRVLTTLRQSHGTRQRLAREALPTWAAVKLHIPEVIREELGAKFRGEVLFANHHEAHAASAFFPSPFDEAGILTLDAVGEWSTTTIGVGSGNRIRLEREQRFPNSLGMLYSAFTHYCGFKVNSGEYKLMGLAPYGRPVHVDTIYGHLVRVEQDGSLALNMKYFGYDRGAGIITDAFQDLFEGPPRRPETPITAREMNLAASIQRVCEDGVLAAARETQRTTGLDRLVMAGGVALNCVANGRLYREGPFRDIWVQPAAGDAGGALGAALLGWHHQNGGSRRPAPSDSQRGSFLGPGFTDDEIGLYLDSVGANYRLISDENELLDDVCERLNGEQVGGWFQGRMEYGPRALGHRSIIGDPRSSTMQRVMNQKIKFRESFRPFAPCILREHVHEVFECDTEQDWPYMLFVASVRERWRRKLSVEDRARMSSADLRVRVSVPRSMYPAITHVDYSARVQTVDSDRHGRFYRLLKRFHEATGCPMLVNTSFNVRGEPIVCTPANAFECFMATGMDFLVLDDYLLTKDEQPDHLGVGSESHLNHFDLD